MIRYYHLTTWRIQPEHIGQTISTKSWEVSNYWSQKLTTASAEATRGRTMEYLAQIGVAQPSAPVFSDLLVHCKYAQELLKEYIFEDVRVSRYPSAPSRKRCMFLFDPTPDPWAYLSRLGFTPQGRTVVEVEPVEDANLLRVDSDLLNSNLLVHAETVERARSYWSGTDGDGPSVEILCEGELAITRVVA